MDGDEAEVKKNVRKQGQYHHPTSLVNKRFAELPVIYKNHIFITSLSPFHGFITNQFNDLLPVGLLAQFVERCTDIAEVKGSYFVHA